MFLWVSCPLSVAFTICLGVLSVHSFVCLFVFMFDFLFLLLFFKFFFLSLYFFCLSFYFSSFLCGLSSLVIQQGVRPEAPRWETQVQDGRPPENSDPKKTLINESSPHHKPAPRPAPPKGQQATVPDAMLNLAAKQ